MSKKIIIGVIILAAISILAYLCISGFFNGNGNGNGNGITPDSNSIEIPAPPSLPE